MQDPSFWGKAVEQLPAMTLSLAVIMVLTVRGMRFFEDLTAKFMDHQDSRDQLFAEQIKELGEGCHAESSRREARMIVELGLSREVMSKGIEMNGRVVQALDKFSA